MTRRTRPRAAPMLLAVLVSTCAAPALARETTSGDAYVRHDEAANTWTMGTALVEQLVRLDGGVYATVSLRCRTTGREYVARDRPVEEFRVVVDGRTYTGSSGGWRLVDSEATLLGQGEIQLVVRLENDVLRVTRSYLVHPGSSIVRQWASYQNAGARPVRVSDPHMFAGRFLLGAAEDVRLNYMTGGGAWTGAQTLKDVQLTPDYARTFDTTDQPESRELAGVKRGRAMEIGSGIYMPWFCFREPSGGVFVGFDYWGRWAADIGRFEGAPGHVGIRVAGYAKDLAPGESVLSPKAFIGVFAGDLDAMGRELREWQYRYLWDLTSDQYFSGIRYLAEMRYQFGVTTAAFGGGTQDNWDYRTQSLFHAVEVMRQTGADILWQDAGWHNHLGDNQGPDFAEVKRYLQKHGMELAVWWPPYEVARESQIAKAHPEWLTAPAAIYGPGARHVNLDTARPDVIEYLLRTVNQKVAEWGPFQWRLDGSSIVPVGGDETPMLRQSHNMFGLLERFRRENPDASIDLCAGGGNLMGFETLRVSDVSQLADSGPMYVGNYYSSYLFPPDKIDDWTRVGNFTWEHARSSLTMAASWTSDRGLYGHEPGLLLNDGLENLRRTFETYHYLVAQGVAGRWSHVYHPRVEGDDPVHYFQRLSGDGRRGVVILKRFITGPVTIFPKGLHPEERYDVRFARSRQLATRIGRDLMDGGITLVSPEPGELIYLGLPNHPDSGADRTGPGEPGAVRKRTGTNMGVSGVELSWEPAMDDNWLSYYQLYRDGQPIAKVAKGTFYFDVGGGIEHLAATYEVQAVDGDSNASARITAVEAEGALPMYTARMGYLAGNDYSYQGANGWRYEEWAGEQKTPLVWNGGLGQQGLYEGVHGTGADKVLIGASWMKPSEGADAVRVFTAPYGGTLTVSAAIHKDVYHLHGDGVRVRMLRNDQPVWPTSGWQTLAADDTAGIQAQVELAVEKSDRLQFVVNRHLNPVDDHVVWNATIAYKTIGSSPGPPARTLTDDVSTRLKYEGQWQRLGVNPWSSDLEQGYLPGWTRGTLTVGGTPGDTLTVKFRGTGIEILGQTGSDHGIAEISLDGQPVATIDTFAPQQIIALTPVQSQIRGAARWAQASPVGLWGRQDLRDGDHELQIEVTGRRNEGSTGTFIGIDGIVVFDGSVVAHPEK